MHASKASLKVRENKVISRLILIAMTLVLLIASGTALAAVNGVNIQDVNPNSSDLDATDPDGASGGRVGGLARVPGNNQIFYAASEWGGLFESTDGGVNWFRLDGHLPTVTWDVEVDPSNTQRIYATSFYDGRTSPQSGIQVSTDGGSTWTRPATATPPSAFNCAASRRGEPSAFGIGIRPDASQNVFVGTNCGVALSTDSGATWAFVDPTPATTASDVWDIVVQAGGPTGQGIVDICGDDGHFRSTDGGTNWTGGTGLPGGTCSIAVSPDESYVLFVVVGTRIYESDDAGATWTQYTNPSRQGRIPFVATNARSGNGGRDFDFWFGDVSLHRRPCTTPASPAPGGAVRCPALAQGSNGVDDDGNGDDLNSDGTITCPAECVDEPDESWIGRPGGLAGDQANGNRAFTRLSGAHDDAGDMAFDASASVDACPEIFSSDGGVYYNTDNSADCHNPNWEQPNTTPHALWLFTMAGFNRAGDATEDLYMGAQDDGAWANNNIGAANPAGSWHNQVCCDVFDSVSDGNRVLRTVCCSFQIAICNTALTSCSNIPSANNPPGCCVSFLYPDFLATFGDKQFVAATGSGLFFTNDVTNIGSNPWTQIGASSSPGGGFCAVQVAFSGGTPTFYAMQTCGPDQQNAVWRYTGTGSGSTWTRVDNTDGLVGGFGIFAADRNNPNRLYASYLGGVSPQMVFSTDGGTNWNFDTELDNLMTGGGVFKYQTQRGPTDFTGFLGYVQPSLVAFDPEDANIIVAGGRDSGVFISTNGGADWGLLTDPINGVLGPAGKQHLPRPRFAYFDHEPAGALSLYIGTQGRGAWRLTLRQPTANAGGPYVTNEGTNVQLNGSGTDPDGGLLTFAWDLDNDSNFNDALISNPIFDRVGQDGVFTVRLKVSAGGVFTIATTTVTVNNVPPTVILNSNAPQPEGSAVTVNGVVSDPGWLDPLTATIDWGDGTPIQPIAGTLENVRPDATLIFSTTHIYGDNGTFTAQVCGSDDDTTTCQTISSQIDNVSPTAEIDGSGTTLINGVPTFIAHAGQPLNFKGRSTDPGSDDLLLSWDWGDGLPSPDVTTTYLVNPPNPDPFPSPSVQPRDVLDQQTQAFAKACLYTIQFLADDDDNGHGEASAPVLITGNADRLRPSGYWQHQFGRQGHTDFDEPTLHCYLLIVDYVSLVFNVHRDASTIPAAYDVLFLQQNEGSAAQQFDRELLTGWLNFANGAIEYNQLFDTNGDGVADTPFAAIVAVAETIRVDPSATEAQLRAQKNILHQLNLNSP